MKGGKAMFLSDTRREIPVMAVANAVPIYPMSCFKFPKNRCEGLDAAIARSCWNMLTIAKADGEWGLET